MTLVLISGPASPSYLIPIESSKPTLRYLSVDRWSTVILSTLISMFNQATYTVHMRKGDDSLKAHTICTACPPWTPHSYQTTLQQQYRFFGN